MAALSRSAQARDGLGRASSQEALVFATTVWTAAPAKIAPAKAREVGVPGHRTRVRNEADKGRRAVRQRGAKAREKVSASVSPHPAKGLDKMETQGNATRVRAKVSDKGSLVRTLRTGPIPIIKGFVAAPFDSQSGDKLPLPAPARYPNFCSVSALRTHFGSKGEHVYRPRKECFRTGPT